MQFNAKKYEAAKAKVFPTAAPKKKKVVQRVPTNPNVRGEMKRNKVFGTGVGP